MSEINNKYIALGGSKGPLGTPNGLETACPDGVGRFRHYQGGSIYWSPTTEAHVTLGRIQNVWAQLGWEKSFLGYPLTDEKNTVGPHGKFNHFQHGSIYWKSNIGAHEVHGLIRQHWASNGWETNSNLGFPISDETPTATGSADRFSDFENGVVFWKNGAKHATELNKLTLGGASKPASEVFEAIKKLIVPLLTGKVDGHQLYITSGPLFMGPEPIGNPSPDLLNVIRPVTEYWISGGTVRNRMYKVRTVFGITIDGSADISETLDLWIEIFYDKAKKAVFATPRLYWLKTFVPWPTTCGISAEEVQKKVIKVIDPEINKLHKVGDVPDGINILSLKVMPNGDLNVYIAPL